MQLAFPPKPEEALQAEAHGLVLTLRDPAPQQVMHRLEFSLDKPCWTTNEVQQKAWAARALG